ncbi:hypothetical protein NHQ30_000689 [Ciborinia camelliae]|nr:hypothetical protein NHQ30_000689 [Ciborinia camelliae]
MSPNQGGVYAVSAILACASTLAVGLRFQARRIKKSSFQSDDYLAALSMKLQQGHETLEVSSQKPIFPQWVIWLTALGVETNAIVWTYVEVGVGVVAACLPTLKPIVNRRTPESIVNSVRSAISLNSLNSAIRSGGPESGLGNSSTNLKAYEQLSHTHSSPEANQIIAR